MMILRLVARVDCSEILSLRVEEIARKWKKRKAMQWKVFYFVPGVTDRDALSRPTRLDIFYRLMPRAVSRQYQKVSPK